MSPILSGALDYHMHATVVHQIAQLLQDGIGGPELADVGPARPYWQDLSAHTLR